MKNIFMCLAFVVVSEMGETYYKIENNETEKQLSQEERFNMLFAGTGLSYHQIRKKRTSREVRNNRVVPINKIIEDSTLTKEKYY